MHILLGDICLQESANENLILNLKIKI